MHIPTFELFDPLNMTKQAPDLLLDRPLIQLKYPRPLPNRQNCMNPWTSFAGRLPLHPPPTGLNGIEVWGVATSHKAKYISIQKDLVLMI